MRITYIGPQWGTSLQRAKALQRLGHTVSVIDPWVWMEKPKLRGLVHLHTGHMGVDRLIRPKLLREVLTSRPDLIWVNQGEFLGPKSIKALRDFDVPLVNYANDNPFSDENRRRFSHYRAALPFYDLVVVVFAQAVEAAKRAGARHVIRKFISADEVAHLLPAESETDNAKDRSEVVFVGTWMKLHRGAFVAELIERGVPLSVWGDHWQKAKEWPVIRPHWRGPGVYDIRGYARIIRGAKICLGLVNKASGNLHTDRSIQIPALGQVLCAERTREHLELYKEGEEAVFWDDAAECARRCKELLSCESERRAIAQRGHERALRNNLFNEPVMASILREV